jgi:hypothetical protein
VFTNLGMDVLTEEIRKTKKAMEKSIFSTGLRVAVKSFFLNIQKNLEYSGKKTDEITEMMTIMYRKFSTDHGLALSTPMPFSLEKYSKQITLIESVYDRQFGTAAHLTTPQVVLMQKFFDSIASRVKQSFSLANRDVEAWLKVVMAPLEAQIREHKGQLKRRKQSIERIHEATDDLEEKVGALEEMQVTFEAQKKELLALETKLKSAVANELASLKDAA